MVELWSNDFGHLDRVFENFVARNELGSIHFGIGYARKGA